MTAAGWYPDPEGPGRLRYWDGEQWTDHYHQGQSGATQTDPVAQAMQAMQTPTMDGVSVPAHMIAEPGKRVLARIIDWVVCGIVGWVLIGIGFAGILTGDSGGILAGLGMMLFVMVASIAYEVVCIGKWGYTIGKKAMNIKVVAKDGTPATWGNAIVRWLVPWIFGVVPIIGGMISILLLIVSLVWLLGAPPRQTVSDKAAGTVVVNA